MMMGLGLGLEQTDLFGILFLAPKAWEKSDEKIKDYASVCGMYAVSN